MNRTNGTWRTGQDRTVEERREEERERERERRGQNLGQWWFGDTRSELCSSCLCAAELLHETPPLLEYSTRVRTELSRQFYNGY